MKTSKLLYHLRRDFPKRIACKGDFIGLQTGKLKKEINTIVICLDFDDDIFNKIKEQNVDLILTHHPLIYGKRKEVLDFDKVKNKLVHTIDKLHIPVYSMHTNFDASSLGMNVALANSLKLKNIRTLDNDNEKMMRGGELDKEMDAIEFAKYVKKQLKLPAVYLINRGKKKIKSVAICGGAGGGMFRVPMEEGYDIYVSGDAPHHIRHDINCYHYNYLEIMHEAEQIFVPTMKEYLKNLDKDLKIIALGQDYPTFF